MTRMHKSRGMVWGICLFLLGSANLLAEDHRVYELRVYYAAPGKLEALNARFRDHTVKLFEKHGIVNIGYWVPVDNPDNKLIYVLAYPSAEARATSWKAFSDDPAWQQAKKASEVSGRLVAKVEAKLMSATDYSPPVQVTAPGNRVFEMRTYTATKGNLGLLNARFRDHTVKLFEKHGMTNVVYWNLLPSEEGADRTLIYILSHASQDAAKASFGAFRTDPAWLAARQASEEKGGGSLTEAQGGVVSVFMTPTDYSPMK
ncbi:MAG: NIPSNAP family protein [Pirellulaceae bacterium]